MKYSAADELTLRGGTVGHSDILIYADFRLFLFLRISFRGFSFLCFLLFYDRRGCFLFWGFRSEIRRCFRGSCGRGFLLLFLVRCDHFLFTVIIGRRTFIGQALSTRSLFRWNKHVFIVVVQILIDGSNGFPDPRRSSRATHRSRARKQLKDSLFEIICVRYITKGSWIFVRIVSVEPIMQYDTARWQRYP